MSPEPAVLPRSIIRSPSKDAAVDCAVVVAAEAGAPADAGVEGLELGHDAALLLEERGTDAGPLGDDGLLEVAMSGGAVGVIIGRPLVKRGPRGRL